MMDVPSDGSCLFHAAFVAFYQAKKGRLIDPMKNEEKMKKVSERLREAVVDYVLRNYRRPLAGVPGNSTGKDLIAMEYGSDPELKGRVKGPATYQRYMKEYGTFAGETELHGLSGLLQCGIVVHPFNDAGERVYYNVMRGPKAVQSRENAHGDVIIHLCFNEAAQHYTAIVRRPGPRK
jgi:hypothetical protein